MILSVNAYINNFKTKTYKIRKEKLKIKVKKYLASSSDLKNESNPLVSRVTK